MKLEHGKVIQKPKYNNVYKFYLRFMIGDADGWLYETLYVSPDNKHIERFITFLDDCEKAYPYGRGGGDRDNYQRVVPEWNVFCGEDFSDNDHDLNALCFGWPYEPESCCQASFDRYTITYFNADGVEHEVKVVK
jgi:hypothetical protein